MKPSPWTRGEGWYVAGVTLAVALVHSFAFASVRVDDAFITFRYGENLATGAGFVFNEGERLLGTTSPGHAVLSALLHVVVGHARLPSAMSAVGALAWTAQATLVWALVRTALGRPGAALVALGIAAGAARTHQLVALESSLLVALALGSLLLALRGRWTASAWVLGLAVFTRADAAILGLVWLGLGVRVLGWRMWRPAAIAAILPIAWVIFATLYFGTPMPNTFAAKVSASHVDTYALHILRLPASTPLLFGRHLQIAVGLEETLAMWALALIGAVALIVADRRLAALVAWAVLHALAYLALHPNKAFFWHLYPLLVVFSVCALTGVVEVARAAGRMLRAPRAAWAVALAVPLALAYEPATFARDHRTMFWFGAREAVVEKVAVYLRPRLQPDDLLDAEEVGTLTYWAGCRVIDHAGLVTRRERVELGEVDRVAAHRRNLAREPHLRWLVMNEADLPLHAGLFDPASLVEFDQPSLEDVPWRLWVAEVPRPAAHPGGGESN